MGDVGTTGITPFVCTSLGNIRFYYTDWENSGNSLTASTVNGTILFFFHGSFFNPISVTAVNAKFEFSKLGSGLNAIALTTITSGTITAEFCLFSSGTSSSVNAGTGTTVQLTSCIINSSNTNALTGAGTLNSYGTIFYYTSSQSNVTTQTGGAASGLTQGTAPSAGFLGETIASSSSSGTSISNNSAKNITSISLTPGIWDVTSGASFAGITTGTYVVCSITTSSATIGLAGINTIGNNITTTNAGGQDITIAGIRFTLSSTTTVYLVAKALYSAGTGQVQSCRISATRVG